MDYERELLTHRQFPLQGRYAGNAVSRFPHEIEVEDAQGLSHLRGFSGSPVFSWFEYEAGNARISLCGMAIQGTIESGRVRFIEWQVIAEAIKSKVSVQARYLDSRTGPHAGQ